MPWMFTERSKLPASAGSFTRPLTRFPPSLLFLAPCAEVLLDDGKIGRIGEAVQVEVVPAGLPQCERLESGPVSNIGLVDDAVDVTVTGARRLGVEHRLQLPRQRLVVDLFHGRERRRLEKIPISRVEQRNRYRLVDRVELGG